MFGDGFNLESTQQSLLQHFTKIPNVFRTDMDQFLFDIAYDCEDFLLECLIANTPFNCCENATPVLHANYGVCYNLSNHTRRQVDTLKHYILSWFLKI